MSNALFNLKLRFLILEKIVQGLIFLICAFYKIYLAVINIIFDLKPNSKKNKNDY